MRGWACLWLVLGVLTWGTGIAEAGCAPERFEGNDYTVCRFDLRKEKL